MGENRGGGFGRLTGEKGRWRKEGSQERFRGLVTSPAEGSVRFLKKKGGGGEPAIESTSKRPAMDLLKSDYFLKKEKIYLSQQRAREGIEYGRHRRGLRENVFDTKVMLPGRGEGKSGEKSWCAAPRGRAGLHGVDRERGQATEGGVELWNRKARRRSQKAAWGGKLHRADGSDDALVRPNWQHRRRQQQGHKRKIPNSSTNSSSPCTIRGRGAFPNIVR